MKAVRLLVETRTICSLPAAISVCIVLNWSLSINNQSGYEPLNLENGLSVNSDKCALNHIYFSKSVKKLCSATLTPVSSVLPSKTMLKWNINTLRLTGLCVLKQGTWHYHWSLRRKAVFVSLSTTLLNKTVRNIRYTIGRVWIYIRVWTYPPNNWYSGCFCHHFQIFLFVDPSHNEITKSWQDPMRNR